MANDRVSTKGLKDIPLSALQDLENKKIFFGHKSVGNNIVDGLQDIFSVNEDIHLNLKETVETNDFAGPIFAHANIGENHKPLSKLTAFSGLMKNGIGERVDIAFFKFCFVDINDETNVDNLLESYKKEMAGLKKQFPQVTFVHVTTPLIKRKKMGIKGTIASLLGRKSFYDDNHNIARNRYNQSLIETYKEKEPIFDLAEVESIYPDGRRAYFTKNGTKYSYLVPEYTKGENDAGHLNTFARKKVAEQMLVFLAELKR